MTPRATIDPLPLLPVDSATSVLLFACRDAIPTQTMRGRRDRALRQEVGDERLTISVDAQLAIHYDPVDATQLSQGTA